MARDVGQRWIVDTKGRGGLEKSTRRKAGAYEKE